MYRIFTISVFCLLLSLDNVENFNLIQNKIFSRVRKQSLELKSSTPIARELHTCSAGCSFTLSFTDPLVLPDHCHRIETNNSCEINAIIDYTTQEIAVYSYENAESLTIGNITYDSSTIHFAYFEFNVNSTYHFFDYTCARGNFCEWEYVQQTLPKLLVLDYQSIYHSLFPRIHNSNGHPDITQCYDDNELVNCSTGSCEFFQSADDDYNPEIIRSCSDFEDNSIEIGNVRFLPGPARHDYDILSFTCDQDKCNDQSNEYEIRQIISSKGNEYISTNSLGTKFICNFYFLSVALMIYISNKDRVCKA